MNNPFDDNSALSGDSQIDGFIHLLNLDSHPHGNLQSSESDVDLQNLLQHLDSATNLLHGDSEIEHPSQDRSLHHSGSEEEHSADQTDPFHIVCQNLDDFSDSGLSNSSSDPLVESSRHEIFERLNHLDELKPDNPISDILDLASTDLSRLTVTHLAENPTFQSFETAIHLDAVNQPQSLNYTDSGAITPDDTKSIEFIGNSVWWHGSGWGQAGTVDGHKFYRHGEYIGRLGADLNVYDADGHKIGYVTPSGKAYTPDDKLFATDGTARWAAATLVFNTCNQS